MQPVLKYELGEMTIAAFRGRGIEIAVLSLVVAASQRSDAGRVLACLPHPAPPPPTHQRQRAGTGSRLQQQQQRTQILWTWGGESHGMNAGQVYRQLQAVQKGGSHPVFWGHLKYGSRVGWMDGNMKSDQSFS